MKHKPRKIFCQESLEGFRKKIRGLCRTIGRSENQRGEQVLSNLKPFEGFSILCLQKSRGQGHCVLKQGFTRTYPRNQDLTVKLKSELIFIRFQYFSIQSVSHKRFHQCVNHKKNPKFETYFTQFQQFYLFPGIPLTWGR